MARNMKHVDIPTETHRRVKALAAKRGETIELCLENCLVFALDSFDRDNVDLNNLPDPASAIILPPCPK